LVSDFVKEKSWHFCLFKIDRYTGVSLWHFHVYLYHGLIWFISSTFLLSTFVPFFVLIVVLSRGTLWNLQKFSQYIKQIIIE
jgi:hypothetical protein